MDFKIGEGFRQQGGIASLDLAHLSDTELVAARNELDNVGTERGLWVPESAGKLVTAQTVDLEKIRIELISGIQTGVNLYAVTINALNANRPKKARIVVENVGDYTEFAEEWLQSDEVIRATAALPVTPDRPRLVIPQLTRSVTTEEIVDAWKHAANGNLWSWSDRMKMLNNWSANQLSGFKPENEDLVTFAVVPTAYDEAREGTVTEQTQQLTKLRQAYPNISPVSLFGGAVVAHKYKNDQTHDWRDTYVRPVDLNAAVFGGDRYVPDAHVNDDGAAGVYASPVGDRLASRLQVG